MSEYTLNVRLKDPQGFFKQIKDIEQNGIGGASQKAAGSGGLMNRLASLNMTSVLKLAGIAFGVGQLVNLTIKSSGILQGTLKMWQNMIMLILKPVGDFIGLALRPLTMGILLTIMPHMPEILKFFREAGIATGAALTNPAVAAVSGGPLGIQSGLAKQIDDAALGVVAKITSAFNLLQIALNVTLAGIPGRIFGVFSTVVTTLSNTLVFLPTIFFDIFSGLGTQISNVFVLIPDLMFDIFGNLAISLSTFFLGIPGMIVGVFSGLGDALAAALAAIPDMIAKAILSWIPDGLGIPGPSGNRPGMPRTRNRTTVAAIADTL